MGNELRRNPWCHLPCRAAGSFGLCKHNTNFWWSGPISLPVNRSLLIFREIPEDLHVTNLSITKQLDRKLRPDSHSANQHVERSGFGTGADQPTQGRFVRRVSMVRSGREHTAARQHRPEHRSVSSEPAAKYAAGLWLGIRLQLPSQRRARGRLRRELEEWIQHQYLFGWAEGHREDGRPQHVYPFPRRGLPAELAVWRAPRVRSHSWWRHRFDGQQVLQHPAFRG